MLLFSIFSWRRLYLNRQFNAKDHEQVSCELVIPAHIFRETDQHGFQLFQPAECSGFLLNRERALPVVSKLELLSSY